MTESPRQDPLYFLGIAMMELPDGLQDEMARAIAFLRAERARVEEVAKSLENPPLLIGGWPCEFCGCDPQRWATILKEGK